jgi:hypothetical protein
MDLRTSIVFAEASKDYIMAINWFGKTVHFCTLAILMIPISGVYAESAPPPLVTIAKITGFSPTDFPITVYDERLFFSQYDKSGNNFDVIAFDITNQSSEYVLRGRYGGRFIAQNDKYLIVSEKGRFANPLIVIDKATGKQVKQIKLFHPILWARIENNRLVAIQGSWLNSGYALTAPVLVFELPSLKLIKSVEIIGGNDVQLWNGKTLSLGYNLIAYDYNFNEIFKISLPERKRGEGVSCAATLPLRVYKDKAVVVTNCGEILIYDLPTHRLERTIPAYAHFYAVAIMDGLIITTPISEPKQINSAHVYDLYSGKELAILPINATDLFVKGNRLLAVEREFAQPSVMTLYSVNVAALRSGNWRIEQILNECQKAKKLLLDDSNNLYSAIELCKSAGIEGLINDTKNHNVVFPLVKQYALWLNKTFDRGHDAISILEKLQKISPDKEIKQALTEARLKVKVLDSNDIPALTTEEQQTEFARVLDIGKQPTHAETKNIEFGVFSNLFHFSDNRIYVGRYGSRGHIGGGASIGVIDRNTFAQIASIPIAPNDDEYQDAIASITSDKKRIYVSVEYRYPQTGRPNFFIIDKTSLKILKKTQVKTQSTLIFENGRLMACDCFPIYDQSCQILNPVTFKTRDAPNKVCITTGGKDNNAVVPIQSNQSGNRFIALTNDYLVAHNYVPKNAPYLFYPRATNSKPISVQLSFDDPLNRPISVSGNSLLISEGSHKGQLLKIVSLPTGATKTLFGLQTSHSRNLIPLLYNQTLFVGFGHDLIIFDTKNNRLKRYIKNFIPAGFKDNGNGLDINRIDRLMIDRNRLIAITFYGENSQIVPLSDFIDVEK